MTPQLPDLKRGTIHFVSLDPVVGREQAGRRPVLIVSDDDINAKPLVVTVVIGSSGDRVSIDYPTNVRVPASGSGLPNTRFLTATSPAGQLSERWMAEIDKALRFALSLHS